MKVAVLIFMALAVSVILTQANPAAAGTYSISQLDTGMVSDDLYPAINNQGQIVWYHHGCQFQTGDPPHTYTETGKYLFYQGGSLTPLNIVTNYVYPWNYFHAPLPLLNDRGQIGYVIEDYNDGGYKIYFNDGPGSSPQLASGSLTTKWDLQLNQQGQMVWYCSDANSITQVYLFNNGQGQASPITNYTSSAGSLGFFSGLSLNDAGQVVWIDRTWDTNASTYVQNIQLYQGGVTTCIYSTYNNIFFTQINNQGQVVWLEQVTGQSNIMLYDGGSAKPIPGGDGFLISYVTSLQINNRGQVVWLGKKTDTNSEYNIYLYSNGSTTQVTNYTNNGTYVGIIDLFENGSDERTKFAPYLNNNGEIVWVTRVPNSSNPTYLDSAVQVYSGGQVTQLDRWTYNTSLASTWTQDTMHPAYAQINDAGQVTWCRYNGADVPDRNSDFEIYLATPVTLANAIKSLQVLTGMMNVPGAGDVTGDKRIGIEDVIYYLQSASGLR